MIELICGCLERAGDSEAGSSRYLQNSVSRMAEHLGFGRQFSLNIWVDGPVALGRVAIASGNSPPPKPVIHRSGPMVVAADLRLSGPASDDAAHREVFRALASPDFPDRLDGDFAVAVWDTGRRRLTLARDRLGIRPLFLARTSRGGIAFASFPAALVEGGYAEGRFDPAALVALFVGTEPVGTRTWIEDVERLPPGHVLFADATGLRSRRYWRYPVEPPSVVPEDHTAAARALRSGLESAVGRALPQGGTVCTHISAGLDSAAIAALSSRLAGPPAEVIAYCVTSPEGHRHLGAPDEERSARAAARQSGATLVPVPFDMVQDDLLGPLARDFPAPDNPDWIYQRVVADAAARGADRILCGFGGDEVVSYTGEGALLADLLRLRWRAVRGAARELSEPAWRALSRQAMRNLAPPGVERLLRRVAGKPPAMSADRDRAVRPAFRPSQRWTPRVGAGYRQRAALEREALQYRLEHQAWEAARRGLRYVFPLLDWRLIELAAGLPARLQLHGGMRRALFRTAVADLLPQEILARRTKLNPAPSTLYQLAVMRTALVAEAQRVAASPAASAVIDLGEIERQLMALPEPELVAEEIRAKARQGQQLRDARVTMITPFMLARLLAQNEADCAGANRSRPQAA